jgi:hypothetical protein
MDAPMFTTSLILIVGSMIAVCTALSALLPTPPADPFYV